MSAIRDYLNETREREGDGGWTRRAPRETHPAILALVREAEATIPQSPGGTVYNDDVERYVNEKAGDLPPHERHGAGRHPLIDQLASEVYIARCCLSDERAKALEDAALAEGFVPFDESAIVNGGRYVLRLGVVYSGYEVAQYGAPKEVRAVKNGGQFIFLPKGARTRGFIPHGPALIRDAR